MSQDGLMHLPAARAWHGSDLRGILDSPKNAGLDWVSPYPQSSPLGGATNIGPIGYGARVLIMINNGSANTTIYRSTDAGMSWAAITLGTSAEHKSITTDGQGRWLITCGNGGSTATYFTSTDNGLTWQTQTHPSGAFFWYGSGYSNGWFYMGAFSSGTAWRSQDMLNWQTSALATTTNSRRFVGDGNGNVVNTGDASAVVQISNDDGRTWRNGATTQASFVPPIFVNGRLFQLFYNGSNQLSPLWVSDNMGQSFRNVAFPLAALWVHIAHSNGIFIATANSSTTYALSEDGFDWKIPAGKTMRASGYNYVAPTEGGFAGNVIGSASGLGFAKFH
jgi:hypothetical protein